LDSIRIKTSIFDAYGKRSKSKVVETDEATRLTNDDLLNYIVDKEIYQVLFRAIESLTKPNKEIVVPRYFLRKNPTKLNAVCLAIGGCCFCQKEPEKPPRQGLGSALA